MNPVVLLAEDEPVSRVFLVDALTALGVRCDAVDDGLDALCRARARRYDALLLDLNLPGCDGVAILRRVRADAGAASRAAPALALTADDCPRTRQRLLDAGFAAVAHKPIGVEPLAQALRALGLALDASAPHAAHATAPDDDTDAWDDDAALAAAGGNRTIVDTLRTMMLKELVVQRADIAAAVSRGDVDTARAQLHRLQAACGFCGATRLAASARALQASLAASMDIDACVTVFLRDADALLASGR